MSQRIILHVDMDAFYAAIEQRDDPSLRGKALIVGGRERRGVVCTASYEARPFGVHSAQPMAEAMARCPHAIVIPPRMDHYAAVSRQLMAELDRFSPVVEPLSLDEAFLDMTGAVALFGPPDAMAQQLKDAIEARTELTCSVGIGENKFLAKLASDIDKPDGITWVPFGAAAEFLAPLPIRKLWGVGPKSGQRLAEAGYTRIGEIAAADLQRLEQQLGPRLAHHLRALAEGRDERPVEHQRERKSLGSEVTLERDVQGEAEVRPVLRRQCERLAAELRRKKLVARGVRVKLRTSADFRLHTRQLVLDDPVDDSASLLDAALSLLPRFEVLDRPLRLIGAAAFELSAVERRGQLDLFASPEREERRALESTVDSIRDRFGDKIRFGS